MTNTPCACGAPSILHVNGVPTCSEHFFATMDEQVATMAKEMGMPLDVAQKAFAKLIREASES